MGEARTGRPPAAAAPRRRSRPGDSVFALCAVVLLVALLGRSFGTPLRSDATFGTAMTVFVSVVVQALPFLVLGVAISAVLAVLVTPERMQRILPRRPAAAVCVAGIGGFALPGCECGSVPVARRLMDRGLPQAAALTFLLAAPAINPVVLVATAVAFPGMPEMVAARFAASLVASIAVGLIWLRLGRTEWITARAGRHGHAHDHSGGPWWRTALDTARADLLLSGSFLVIGALFVAAFRVLLPADWAAHLASSPVTAVLVMALLAIVLSLCSEADAFIAASMPGVGPLGMIVFLVVGPAIDLKLGVMYAGVFGRRFALRFVPLVTVLALASALLVGGGVLAACGVEVL